MQSSAHLVRVLLLLFAGRCYRSTHIYTTVGILCLLLSRLENLNSIRRRCRQPPGPSKPNIALYLEGTKQRLVDAHHRAGVVELATVVWCREEGDQVSLREELVPVFDDLRSHGTSRESSTVNTPTLRASRIWHAKCDKCIPDVLDRSNPCHVSAGTATPRPDRT